jgi:hypothetical protein
MEMMYMDESKIATEYLVKVLNCRNKKTNIPLIINEIYEKFPGHGPEIASNIMDRLSELNRRARPFEGRSRFRTFSESNNDYLSYIAILSKAMEEKEGK